MRVSGSGVWPFFIIDSSFDYCYILANVATEFRETGSSPPICLMMEAFVFCGAACRRGAECLLAQKKVNSFNYDKGGSSVSDDGVSVDTEKVLLFRDTTSPCNCGSHSVKRSIYRIVSRSWGRSSAFSNTKWHLSKSRRGLAKSTLMLFMPKTLSYDCNIIDGTKDVLESLHGDFLMGVVTSSRKEHFDLIHTFGPLEGFSFVLTGDDYKIQTRPRAIFVGSQEKRLCKGRVRRH